ncbi:MAG: hypothetical protein IT198_05790 [Acidimicrobiia bacterium]|nr:hypothetical protein [Acidimicrobiia bacterium]
MTARPSRPACLRLVAAAVGLLAVVTACAASPGDATRLHDAPDADPLIAEEGSDEPVALLNPEAYGLPPLTTLQTNPGGVAEGLLARQAETTWSMVWQVRDKTGDTAADIIVEHLPASASDSGARKFHVHASVGTGDMGVVQVAILDEGQGARLCAQEAGSTWVCDVTGDVSQKIFDFLSIDGFAELSRLLRESLAIPGLSVQYAKIAGTPAACFYFAPVPDGLASGSDEVDIDLSQGGHFCLSTEGAPIRLATPDLTVTAVEYSKTVDKDRFTLPV